jgi:hypothetical protein
MAEKNTTRRRASWLQFDAPMEMAQEVFRLQRLIDADDIIELEDDPHVTVLYGLQTDDPFTVAEKLRDCGEVRWWTRGVSIFTNPKSYALYLEVNSLELSPLHYKLRDRFPIPDTFGYRPHVTIAKLRPETKMVDYTKSLWRTGDVATFEVISKTIVLHTRNRKRHEIDLT